MSFEFATAGKIVFGNTALSTDKRLVYFDIKVLIQFQP